MTVRNILSRMMCLTLLLAMGQGALAGEKWTVYLNGAKTSMKPIVKADGTVIVPLNFPVQGQQDYQLSIVTDKATHSVQITRKANKPRLRGEEKCYHCSGTGICQDCYGKNDAGTLGSGVNYAGVPCVTCNGTGKCWYCEGTGKKVW